MDQEYELIPGGPRNCALNRRQIEDVPVIEQGGSGNTVSRTSFVSVQPFASVTVRRKVAVADATCAVAVSEFGESISAVPLTRLQPVELMGCRPAVAVPCKTKA